MKKIKHLNKALFGIMGTLGLGGAATAAGILAYTNANVDQLELLTRAVRDNTVEQYKARAQGDDVVKIGNGFSVAIINDRLYTWGNNNVGQLGLGDSGSGTERNVPTEVTETSNGAIPKGAVTEIEVGAHFIFAIIDSRLYSWGYNLSGQLGLGDESNRNIPTEVTKMFDGTNETHIGTITQIAAGMHHASAVIDNRLYTWGLNSEHQLGLGDADTKNRNIPTEVTKTSDGTLIQAGTVTEISNSYSSSAIINGELFTWGGNNWGELGNNSPNPRNRPDKLTMTSNGAIPKSAVTQIKMGGQHAAAIINDRLYTWGFNGAGQLGLNDNDDNNRNIPTEVTKTSDGTLIQPGTVTAISLGTQHSAAIIGQKLYTWGLNSYGQLGLGDQNIKYIPTEVTKTSDGTLIQPGAVTQITMWGNNSAAVINGKIYTWGENNIGQLGIGPTPAYVLLPTTIIVSTKDKDITLDVNNDPGKIRDDIVYNIEVGELRTLIGNANTRTAIGILPTDTFDISPNWKNVGTLDATKKGQIALEIIVTSSNNRKINVNFNGFLPVNLTENVIIPPKTLTAADLRIFANDEINELVEQANKNGVTSKLADWIIFNQVRFIGDTVTKYTPDFPKGANITKINNVEVVDGTKGEIRFQIEVDKYYKQATPATDLIESTTADPVLLITSPIILSEFNFTRESIPIVKLGSDRNIVSAELLKLFKWVDNTTNIAGKGLVELNNYIDLTSFPQNTNFKIINPDAGDNVLTFHISADRFYDAKGILVTPPAPEKEFPITIDRLLNGQSKIVKTTSYPLLPASRILSDIGYDHNNSTKPIINNGLFELKKYVTDLDNFPQQPATSFTLTNVDDKVPGQLSFEVVASNQYNSSGNATGTPLSSGILDFSNLPLAVTTEIKPKTNYKKDILSGDLANQFKQNGFNKAKVEEYVDFNGELPNTSYTFSGFRRVDDTLWFDIVPNATQTNGVPDATARIFPIVISGLDTITNSLLGQFEKTTIAGLGDDIAAEINTNITNGIKINPNSTTWSLWNKLVNVDIYPPDTEFTINSITPDHHGGVFTTFEISVTASKHYKDNETMTTSDRRPIFTIRNLKFNPTAVTQNTQTLPDVKANEFLAYIKHDPQDGSFDATKLQEFVTFTSFDLSTPGTTTKLDVLPNSIVDDKISLTFKVLNYVDANGDGKTVPTYFTLPTFTLDLKATAPIPPVTPGTSDSTGTTDKSTETMILATSIAGGAFLLFLLVLLTLLAIRSKRQKAAHYMKITKDKDISDGDYDQFWKDESDWRESSSKKN